MPSDHRWPAWMWQASQRPFPVLVPSAFSTGTEISWISAPAESLAVPLHGLGILPSSSSRAEQSSDVHRKGFGGEQLSLGMGARHASCQQWPRQASSRSVSLCREFGRPILLTSGQRPPLVGSRCSRGECISSAALSWPGDGLPSHLLLLNVPCWVFVLSMRSGRNPGKSGSCFTSAAFWLCVSSPGGMGSHGCVTGAQPVLIPVRENSLHVERNLGYMCWFGTDGKGRGATLCITHR